MQANDAYATLPISENRALIVARDPRIQATSRHALQHARWQVDTCHSFVQFQALPQRHGWPLVVVADDDQGLPEQILNTLQAEILGERTYVAILATVPSLGQALRLLQLRAFDYLLPPLEPLQLLTLATQVRRLTDSKTTRPNGVVAKLIRSEHDLVGQSVAMINLLKQIARLAPARGPAALANRRNRHRQRSHRAQNP